MHAAAPLTQMGQGLSVLCSETDVPFTLRQGGSIMHMPVLAEAVRSPHEGVPKRFQPGGNHSKDLCFTQEHAWLGRCLG